MNPTDVYLRNLATKALVLSELQRAGSATGNVLCRRIDEACEVASARDASFDFVHWTGATLWGLLETFVASGFVELPRSHVPRDAADWSAATLRITSDGEAFLESAMARADSLMALFAEPRHQQVAAAN